MRAVGLWVLLASCAALNRPPAPPPRFEVRIAWDRFAVSSGVDVFVLPVAGSNIVQLDVRYSMGAASDPLGKSGLAHLVEHLMFEIKVGENGETVGSELARLAQHYNAYTRYDSTHYVTRVAARRLDAAVGLYTKMLETGCDGIDQTTFLREREIVRSEIRENHARPAGQIPLLLLEAVYGKGHAYGRTVGGDDGQLSNATRADACAFIEKHYVGSRATFLFAGDVTPIRVRELASKWLATLPKHPRTRPAHAAPMQLRRGKVITHELDISEPRLYVMWALPKTHSHKGRVAEFAGPELRGVVEWFASTYSFASDVDVETIGGVHAPVLVLSMSLHNTGKLNEALDMVWKSARRVPRELAPNAGMGEYPNSLRHWKTEEILAGIEVLEGRTFAFADYAQFDPQGGFLIDHVKLNEGIKDSEMRNVAASVLDPSKAVAVLVKPRAGASNYEAASQFHGGKIHQAKRAMTFDAAEANQSLPVPPRSRFRREVERYRLSNGLSVVLWPNAELPLVRATLLLRTGSAHETGSRPGIARVAANGVGGFATMDSTLDVERGLSIRVHNTLLVGSAFITHEFGELDQLRARISKQLGFKRDVSRADFAKRLLVGVYGAGHPYAEKGWLTAKSAKKIDRDSTYAFADKHYVANNATLIVAGQFDAKLIKRHIQYAYRRWSSGKADQPVTTLAKRRTAAGRITVDSGASPVTEVNVMYAGNSGIDDSLAARRVLALMLSARLSALREERGLTHGISVSYQARRGPGRWLIEGRVDSRRVAEAVGVLQERIASLRSIDDSFASDFVLARRKIMDSLLTAGSDGYSINERLIFLAEYELPEDFYERYGKSLAELRPTDITALIDRELTDTQQVLGLFGPASAIADGIAAADSTSTSPQRF